MLFPPRPDKRDKIGCANVARCIEGGALPFPPALAFALPLELELALELLLVLAFEDRVSAAIFKERSGYGLGS